MLNFFRQDHGYQDGTYVKQWQGREDNEHLSELLESLDDAAPDFPEQVYQALESRYSSCFMTGFEEIYYATDDGLKLYVRSIRGQAPTHQWCCVCMA